MFTPYSKTTQNAISAMSRLAEVYADEQYLSSLDIAKQRNISKPLVAKILTILSQAGLLTGIPGPTGGYRLAREPGQIRLYDIAIEFENLNNKLTCPFGPDWCGHGDPCPVHHQLVALIESVEKFLKETTLEVFAENSAPELIDVKNSIKTES